MQGSAAKLLRHLTCTCWTTQASISAYIAVSSAPRMISCLVTNLHDPCSVTASDSGLIEGYRLTLSCASKKNLSIHHFRV